MGWNNPRRMSIGGLGMKKLVSVVVESCSKCPYKQYDAFHDCYYCPWLEGTDYESIVEDKTTILEGCPLEDLE